jgi:very-short-patch-repair endonuclease
VLVTTAHGATFELDWAYPDAMVGLELDGYGVHLRSADAFDGDRDRRNELVLAGWEIFNFSSRMCRRNPARVVDQFGEHWRCRKCHPKSLLHEPASGGGSGWVRSIG